MFARIRIKKRLSFLLTIIFILGTFPSSVKAAAEIIIDDGGATTPGTASGWYGSGVTYQNYGTTGSFAEFKYNAVIPEDGIYDIYVWMYTNANYAMNMPLRINYANGGSELINIPDLRKTPGEWVKVGAEGGYPFTAGNYSIVAGGSGYNTYPKTDASGTPNSTGGVIFDAIKLVKTGELPSEEDKELGEQLDAVINPDTYFTQKKTQFRDYAFGTINHKEGTFEFTVQIDRDYVEYGNLWDFLFQVVPAQEGPGNTLINAHIPAIYSTAQVSAMDTYEQPLIFFVKNGQGSASAAYVSTAKTTLSQGEHAFTKGEKFNLAFTYKIGSEGFAKIYKDGELIASAANSSNEPIMEKFMPYEFIADLDERFNISNIKISTKALEPSELETGVQFAKSTDTSLLAAVDADKNVTSSRFVTPYHTSTVYNAVKPAFRLDKQVYYDNENVVYPIALVNYGDERIYYTVSLEFEDIYGRQQFSKSFTIPVPADGKHHIMELAVDNFPKKTGYWSVTAKIKNSSTGVETVYESGISKVPLVGAAGDGSYSNYYGVHASDMYPLEIWKKINVNDIRAWDQSNVFMWFFIEPENDQWAFSRADAYVEEAENAGLDILGVLGYPADWASARPPITQNQDPVGTPDYRFRSGRWVSKDIKDNGEGADWRDYIYTTMKRYAGKVKYWEIINEVNFNAGYLPAAFSGTDAEYFKMLKIAYEVAEQVRTEIGKELYISTSGFTSISGTVANRQMAINALDAPNLNNFDIYNIHGYSGTKGIADVIEKYNSVKQSNPNLQLWQGEYYSYPDQLNVSPQLVVYDTMYSYMDFLSKGFDKYFNMGMPSNTGMQARFNLSPTPNFTAMAVMQSYIRKVNNYEGSYEFIGQSLLPMNHSLSMADGKILSILGSPESSVNIYISNDDIVSVKDMFGNDVTPIENEEGYFYYNNQNILYFVSGTLLDITGASTMAPPIILKNGGFEHVTGDPLAGAGAVSPNNWNMGWQVGIFGKEAYVLGSENYAYEGAKALIINSSGSPAVNNRVYMNQEITVNEAGRYILSAYIKKISGEATPELNIWDGGQDCQLVDMVPNLTLTEDYKYYSFIYDITEDDLLTKNYIINAGILSGTGIIAIDNVSLTRLPDGPVEIIIDDFDASGIVFNGTWDTRTGRPSNYNENFHLATLKADTVTAVYSPIFPISGKYKVEYYTHYLADGASNAKYTVIHANGTDAVRASQREKASGWHQIGEFSFLAGAEGSVTLHADDHDGNYIVADAIRFTRVGDMETNDPQSELASALAAVNAAANAGEMEAAIKNTILGLDLNEFILLIPDNQALVLAILFENKPLGGYTDIGGLQLVIDNGIENVLSAYYLELAIKTVNDAKTPNDMDVALRSGYLRSAGLDLTEYYKLPEVIQKQVAGGMIGKLFAVVDDIQRALNLLLNELIFNAPEVSVNPQAIDFWSDSGIFTVNVVSNEINAINSIMYGISNTATSSSALFISFEQGVDYNMGEGESIYIHIGVIDDTQKEFYYVFGPYKVDMTPPDITSVSALAESDSTLHLTSESVDVISGIKLYQWQLKENGAFVNIPDADSKDYIHSGLLPDTAYEYRLIVTDYAGNQAISTAVTASTASAPKPDTFTVTYLGNGAVGGSAPLDSNLYQNGGKVTVLGRGSLYRTGYFFAGWTLSANGSGIVYLQGDVLTITRNIVLYAIWDYDNSTANTNSGGDYPAGGGELYKNPSTTEPSAVTIDKDGENLGINAINTRKSSYVLDIKDDGGYVTLPAGFLTEITNKNESFVFEVTNHFGVYFLPVNINNIIDGLSALLEEHGLTEKDIAYKVTMAYQADNKEIINAFQQSFPSNSQMIGSMDFLIIIINQKTGEVIGEANVFSEPVRRLISIGSVPARDLAAFCFNEQKFEFVPHRVINKDGKRYMEISSKKNSIYVVIENTASFSDVSAGHWGAAYIEKAASKGLVKGVGNNMYAPQQSVTRAEFVQMIVNSIQLPEINAGAQPYPDISKKWYYEAIMKAKSAGLLDKFRGNFKPTDPITREEMAAILAAAVNHEKLKNTAHVDINSVFSDHETMSSEYTEDIQTVYNLRLMQGTGGGRFEPRGATTRAQAATVLINLLKALNYID